MYGTAEHRADAPRLRTRHVGAVADFMIETQAQGRLAFSAEEIAERVPTDGRALEAALRRQVANGALARIAPRTGYFLIVPPEHRAMGAPPVEAWLDDLMRHVGRPYYVGLLSAAERRGSSHFAVMETQVVTTGWMRPIQVGRTRLRFFQRPAAAAMPAEVLQGEWGPLRIAWPETLALDLLQHSVCGIDRTALILSDLSASFRRKRLVAALDAGGDVPTAQRLGFLLERLGRERDAKAVADWLAPRPRRTVDLTPGVDGANPLDPRWLVRGTIPDGILA